jgi:hypothetical protein
LNEKHFYGIAIVVLIILAGYFVYNKMNDSLPEEGRQALEKKFQFYEDEFGQDHFDFEVTSSQKAKNINTNLYTAIYCVTITPPFERDSGYYYANFFVYQKGNSWSVESINGASEEMFLEYECDNWVHERGDPYNARNNG